MRTGNVTDVVARYNTLKRDILPFASKEVEVSTRKEMAKMRNALWVTLASIPNDQHIVFNSPVEVISVVSMLLDTGKIFGLDWKRKTNSKSDPTKVAGSIDTLTVKKVNGYVKGTSGGKKAVEDTLADRMTLWVANGKLYSEGYGNWRTIYGEDVKGIHLGGVQVVIEIM